MTNAIVYPSLPGFTNLIYPACSLLVAQPSKQVNSALRNSMNAHEKKAVAALAAIFALRMFGLFMLLPLLAIYAAQFPHSTPLLIGLALGIYGLTQGLLQIAFGMASDRFGRKRVIAIGLLIFAFGSVLAALADSIGALLIGRALQGAGAISSALLALAADLTRETQRTNAMAVMGVSIGVVFVLSLMFAPLLESLLGVPGIFWLSVALALAAMVVLWRIVPPAARHSERVVALSVVRFRRLLVDAQLLRLNGGVFCLHMVLTALFVVLPGFLHLSSGLPLAAHWKLYAPVLLLSVLGMLPLLRFGARRRRLTAAFNWSVALLLISSLAMAYANQHGIVPLLMSLWLFFVAFNTLEAMLPSLVSRLAPPADKGTAIGVYHTFQFLGMFAGGFVSGWLSGQFGMHSVYWLCAAIAGLWLASASTAPKFRFHADA